MKDLNLDVITIGRSSVDLYGIQIGGRLEDMSSFAKYLGGSPTNTAAGASRLGLKSAVITGVGDEHMGRYIIEQLRREGVDTRGVKTDPERLTAVVILGIRDQETFPLIFYRENCADMALTEDDIDPGFIRSARSVVLSGTHFSTATVTAMSRKAAEICRDNGGRVAFDIDYRPVLWGIGGHGTGEARFAKDGAVTEHLQAILPLCDLIVGTEEELHIAGGATDTLEAIRAVRAVTDAAIVCKRGPMGCVVFPGDIPDDIENGIRGPGFPVEVYNVLGAGDAFMSGFLRGWLRDESWETCAKFANACGAFAVSRHGCTPAMPSWTELSYFLEHGSSEHALRKDDALNHVHWATTRRRDWPALVALAIDHRAQFEEMVEESGGDLTRIGEFKKLAIRALDRVADGRPGFGTLLDGRTGKEALHGCMDGRYWVGRPVELPGSRPLRFEAGPNIAGELLSWPADQVVKCLVFYHPDDPDALRREQEQTVVTLFEACRQTEHELLLEIISSKAGRIDAQTTARAMQNFYDLGVKPDWWKLEPAADDKAWREIGACIERNDPYCRGILVLGLDAPMDDLIASFETMASHHWVKGFAIGRTVFGDAARAWLAGKIDDAAAVDRIADRFGKLVEAWGRLRDPYTKGR